MSYTTRLFLFCFSCLLVTLTITALPVFSPPLLANQDAEKIEQLVEKLGSDSFHEREAAMESIQRIGRAALPALRKAQNSTDAEIRKRAKTLVEQIDVTLQSLLNRKAYVDYYENQEPSPKSVCKFGMPSKAFSDYDLIIVRDFVNMRLLDLSSARITNAGLVQIGSFSLSNLERLNIDQTHVSDISPVRKLSKLKWLGLSSLKISDKDLEVLKELPDLETINLGSTNITDAGLVHLKHLKKLRQLTLAATKITDKGMAYLPIFKELTYLHVADTQITDAGLVHLKKLKKLKHLVCHRTKVTAKGIADFKKSLPFVGVTSDWDSQTSAGR